MDRFVSHFTNRLDAKGGFNSGSFRAVLMRDGFSGLFVHPSLDRRRWIAAATRFCRRSIGLLAKLSPYSEERDLFSTAFFGASEILKVDPEGRVVLTETIKAMRDDAGSHLRRARNRFQIWEPSRFQAHLEEAKHRVRDFAKTVQFRIFDAGRAGAATHGARE